jgi:hypothetical protein
VKGNVFSSIQALGNSGAEKDRTIAELAYLIAGGRVLRDLRGLRNFAFDLGADDDLAQRTRWAVLNKIIDVLLQADTEYVKRYLGVANEIGRSGSQLEGWTGIIVKDS